MGTTPGGGRLGEILIANAGLSYDDIARGLAVARAAKTRLGSALVGMGLCEADVVATALAQLHGVAAARDKHLDAIAPETRALLSMATAVRLCAVPVGVTRGDAPALVIAMRDPGDAAALEALARETGYRVQPAVACEARLLEAIEAWGDDESALPQTTPRATRSGPSWVELTPLPGPRAASQPIGPPGVEIPPAGPPAIAIPLAGPPAIAIPLPGPPAALEPPPAARALPSALERAFAEVAPDTDGALDVPDSLGPAPTFERALLTPVPTGLELADVPRRHPASAAPPAATHAPVRASGPMPSSASLRITGAAAPVGAAILDERPVASGSSSLLLRVLGLGVAVAAAVVGYSYCRDDASGGGISGVEVHGTFHSDKLGASLRLPGTGWHEVPGGFDGQLPKMGDNTRADVFMRGDDAMRPDNAVMIVRVTQPGAFPSQVDPAQIRAGLDSMETQAASLSNGVFTVTGLSCKVTTLGPLPLGACAGEGAMLGSSYQLQIFMWIPSTDDAVAMVWFDKDGTSNARTLVDSFRPD